MLPGSISDKIAAPTMRKLVGDHIHILAVLAFTIAGSACEGMTDRTQSIDTLEIILGVAKVKFGFSIPPFPPTRSWLGALLQLL